MASTTVRQPRLMNTPDWVFPWRGRKKTFFSMLVAHVMVGAVFAIMLGTVHVKVISPKPMAPRKASLIYLADDSQGRALALRAQEGGPFPLRFQPSQWEGMAALEAEAMAATRQAKPYVPQLRDLPKETRIAPMELAAKGEPVFPKRKPVARAAPDPAKMKLVPTIYPLSGIPAEAIPTELPPFTGAMGSTITAASWRFLVRLNAQGGVAECVSLEKGGEAGALELESWLHGIQFRTTSEKPFRWISVGIGFSNQPADGPDNR
ncbi:MAG: hypothetical protein ABIT37_04730 [Luteolibacter sp.]